MLKYIKYTETCVSLPYLEQIEADIVSESRKALFKTQKIYPEVVELNYGNSLQLIYLIAFNNQEQLDLYLTFHPNIIDACNNSITIDAATTNNIVYNVSINDTVGNETIHEILTRELAFS